MAPKMKQLCYWIRTSHWVEQESTRGSRTLVVVFELLEEMFAWGCRNGRFKFCPLN